MLRKAGLQKELKSLGWTVDDQGNLPMPEHKENDPKIDLKFGNAKNCYAVGKGCENVMNAVKKAAIEGKFVITLGGDHSLGAGTVAGVLAARPETGIIWVDAHADINTPSISDSGNMHGMPLALVMKLNKAETYPGWEWLKDIPTLSAKQIVYIGLRDVDEGERLLLREHGILAFSMYHVDKYGIGGVMERTLEHLQHRPLHLR